MLNGNGWCRNVFIIFKTAFYGIVILSDTVLCKLTTNTRVTDVTVTEKQKWAPMNLIEIDFQLDLHLDFDWATLTDNLNHLIVALAAGLGLLLCRKMKLRISCVGQDCCQKKKKEFKC